MMRTIFVVVLLLCISVNAQDITIEIDMDPEDCDTKDLNGWTMVAEDPVCPGECGSDYTHQTWSREGESDIICKAGCKKPDDCPGETTVEANVDNSNMDLAEIIVLSTQSFIEQEQSAYDETNGGPDKRSLSRWVKKVIVTSIIPCKPQMGVGWMYIKIQIKFYLFGILVFTKTVYIKLPCCCERRLGGPGRGPPPHITCEKVQAWMGAAQWCSCPPPTWPPAKVPAILAFKATL